MTTPKAWTTARVWQGLGRPAMGLRTVYRRIREQARWCRPRLVAKSDPDHDAICAGIRERVDALPAGSVVLAEDEPTWTCSPGSGPAGPRWVCGTG